MDSSMNGEMTKGVNAILYISNEGSIIRHMGSSGVEDIFI